MLRLIPSLLSCVDKQVAMTASMKIIILATLLLSITNSATAETEDCGPAPSGLRALFGEAKEKFEACNRRRNEAYQRRSEDYHTRQQDTINRVRESCMSAVRRLSTTPSTLSFTPVAYQKCCGLNSADVSITEGGYSATLSGSDANGLFRVTCYTDKRFSVTNMR